MRPTNTTILTKVLAVATLILCLAFRGNAQMKYFKKFPDKANPQAVGIKITERFLSRPHSTYGNPLKMNQPAPQVTYPDVCTWLGGFWFAKATDNKELFNKLEARFQPLFTNEAPLLPKPNHVDNNVFGTLPLELYIQTKDKKYLDMGLLYANTQWEVPQNASASEKKWADSGYTWQTRIWLDDMFMITAVQAQAFKATGDMKYLNRAAKEMLVYLDSIQLPTGLFYHAPSAHFSWGRGNGWMAVGMAELLRALPENNPYRSNIMNAYLKMMATLKENQSPTGMWRQVIDDPTMWEETSCTAMFTYAMIVGVRKGWLNEKQYGAAAAKAWITLTTNYIDENGDVTKVCEGTNIGNSAEHYRNRQGLTGDLHGQAPVLWCAYALTAPKL
ncbi:glycoside hydrolase family 88 protein [Chitinophagaceae bacterium 26-R-25]|nr:glycoside hydrolase family 88 protein [Chitinophagaceae bacterium 26-R-25]